MKMIQVLLVIGIAIFVNADQDDIHVRSLRIKSDIQSRFATTLITSRLINPSNEAKEISFLAQLPDAAFISNFSMQIGNQIIVGDVKEKEQAKIAYDQAKARGESAGLVAQKARETNAFTISTNLAAHDKVTFNLTYQEILKRVHGAYKHVINLQSDKLLKSSQVQIEVHILEQGNIVNVSVPKFGPKIGEKTNRELINSEQEPNAQTTSVMAGSVSTTVITYKPKMDRIDSENGTLAGQLAVLYDVQRDLNAGEIQVVNGYFVHFFAPKGLQIGAKHVIFVLDQSGSMQATNIYDSLVDALRILNSTRSQSLASMIIFMTDGQPNEGTISDADGIVQGITELNKNTKFIIHSIAFGDDADFNLVQRISANNFGLARKVYEDSDADLQLTGFYEEISSPLLTQVKIDYLNETVDVNSLIQDQSYNYYDGGELMIIGKLKDNSSRLVTFDSLVSAKSAQGPMYLRGQAQTMICPGHPIITEDDEIEPCCLYPRCDWPTTTERPLLGPSTVGGFVERMWAYQTIKKLLKDAELGNGNSTEKKQEALRLSLKYHFVTEMTSMVVVQPNQNTTSLEMTSDHQSSNDVHDHFAYRPISRSGHHFGPPQARTIIAFGPPHSAGYGGSPGQHGPHAYYDLDDAEYVVPGPHEQEDYILPPSPPAPQPTSTRRPFTTCKSGLMIVITSGSASINAINLNRITQLINVIRNTSTATWELDTQVIILEGNHYSITQQPIIFGSFVSQAKSDFENLTRRMLNSIKRRPTRTIGQMASHLQSLKKPHHMLMWIGGHSNTKIHDYFTNQGFQTLGISDHVYWDTLMRMRTNFADLHRDCY